MSCILSFPHGFLLRLICRFLLTLLVCLKNTTTTTSIEKFFYLAYKNLLPIHFFHVSHIHSLYNYHQKVKSGFCSFLFVFLEATHANAKKNTVSIVMRKMQQYFFTQNTRKRETTQTLTTNVKVTIFIYKQKDHVVYLSYKHT